MLDTSFLVAYYNSRDVHHPAAMKPMKDIIDGRYGPALLPEYVFLELETVLMLRRDLAAAVQVGDLLLGAVEVELVPCFEIFTDAYEIFRSQNPGTDLSFVDSAIVAVARIRQAQNVASFDKGFTRFEEISLVPG